MMTRVPILEVDALEVVYETENGSIPAIRDVSFSLDRKEALGLVGESGSGKTTIGLAIVHHLADNGRISGGSIRFDGTDVVPLTGGSLRRVRGHRIAMVYQDPASALNPSLRIGEQIAEVYRKHASAGGPDIRDRTVALLERVHLPDAAYAYSRYPHEFSGGQQQRIVIAMALAMNPDLLILDEPTTGLDVTVEAEILDLFAELRRSVNAAFLFISHNIAVIAKMCDRIGALYAGQLVELGPTEDVLAEPSHPYTRKLLSARIPFGATKADLALAAADQPAPEEGRPSDGCSFEPHCVFAKARCRTEGPPLLKASATWWSRCFFHEEVHRSQWRPDRRGAVSPNGQDGDTLLEVRTISKYFRSGGRSFQAVAGATLFLKRGSIFGLVGESGSGKTTTLRIIAGLIVPDNGAVILEGKDITRVVHRRDHETRSAIQMVFQNPDSTLNPEHRIGQILRRAAKKLTGARGAELEDLVERVIQSVRLHSRHLEAFPDELSGGQRQRVAIARAFVGNPRIVLCDEPTSALDVSIQASVLNLLVELQDKQHNSYIFISHDLAVVRYLADQIAVMYLGEVVELGPADRVFEPPSHPYTETLLTAVLSLNDPKTRRRVRLRGSIPSLLERPQGCPFHPRCPRKVGPICEKTPPWQETSKGHRYRCVIGPAELRRLQSGQREQSGENQRVV